MERKRTEKDDDCKGLSTVSIVLVISLPDFHFLTWVQIAGLSSEATHDRE